MGRQVLTAGNNANVRRQPNPFIRPMLPTASELTPKSQDIDGAGSKEI